MFGMTGVLLSDRRQWNSRRRQHELVSIGILENREFTPRLLLRFGHERDAARCELPVCRLNVIASERTVKQGADPTFMSLRGKQDYAGRRVADSKLDPPLLFVENLVGRHFETELFGVELERPILVARRNAHELELGDHPELLLRCKPSYRRALLQDINN